MNVYFGDELKRHEATSDIPLDRLQAVCDAERDGRIVVLPRKIGDIIWTMGCETTVDASGNEWRQLRPDYAFPESLNFALCHLDGIGSRYWLTEQECEDAIEKQGVKWFGGREVWEQKKAQRRTSATKPEDRREKEKK